MANITIGGLPSATSVGVSDLLHITQAGIDKQITGQKIIDLANTDTEVKSASNGDTISPIKGFTSIVVDATGGDPTITLNAPAFLGQRVHITADGPGIVEVNGGNGIYVNSIFVNANTGGARAEAVSDGAGGFVWAFVNDITADYSVGDWDISLYSGGGISLTGVGAQSISTTTAMIGGFRSATSVVSLPLTIASPVDKPSLTSGNTNSASVLFASGSGTTSQFGIHYFNVISTGAASRVVLITIKGKY